MRPAGREFGTYDLGGSLSMLISIFLKRFKKLLFVIILSDVVMLPGSTFVKKAASRSCAYYPRYFKSKRKQ